MRRRALMGALAAMALARPARAAILPAADWDLFKSRFLAADGRIVDNGNGGVSHSEGQGWGLIFAAAADDRAAFDRIQNWTAEALRRPNDSLHAWRWVPKDTPPVKDTNNATDGDIFIAAGLARAGLQWGEPDRIQAAGAIARDILRLLVKQAGPYTVLLPALQGFTAKDAVVVNPSYYTFPFISELAAIVPSPVWATLRSDGLRLIDEGRFGPWALPPDWLRVAQSNGALVPAPGFPSRFSFDAVRVPLWFGWAGLAGRPVCAAIDRFWSAYPMGSVPAWVDLRSNELAPYPLTVGMTAVMSALRQWLGQPARPLPSIEDATKYYDAALVLLCRLALAEKTR
ncbi:MAG: hypothetical protein J0H35_07980 [Rhodospirillales bacterium]|nr:hypothetical protein [Rhodospirillales bacterium]